jgi:hypothetical protein
VANEAGNIGIVFDNENAGFHEVIVAGKGPGAAGSGRRKERWA